MELSTFELEVCTLSSVQSIVTLVFRYTSLKPAGIFASIKAQDGRICKEQHDIKIVCPCQQYSADSCL